MCGRRTSRHSQRGDLSRGVRFSRIASPQQDRQARRVPAPRLAELDRWAKTMKAKPDKKRSEFAKLVYRLRQEIDLFRVIGLNVDVIQ